MTNRTLTFEDDKLLLTESAGSGIPDKTSTFDTTQALLLMSEQGIWDSDFIPPGVFGHKRASTYEQIGVQLPPDVRQIRWGASEGGKHETYAFAMPWTIILGRFALDGKLMGARLFYSPTPMTSWKTPLYHANLPNLNVRGYGQQNAVGWVCLYDWPEAPVSLKDKVSYLVQRTLVAEPFNDGNMAGTDGCRFYQGHYVDKGPEFQFTYDPDVWQKLSKAKMFMKNTIMGSDWMIPVLVAPGDQTMHSEAKTAVPLTVGMAWYGKAKYTYTDPEGIAPAAVGNKMHVFDYRAVKSTGASAPVPQMFAKIKSSRAPKLLDKASDIEKLIAEHYKADDHHLETPFRGLKIKQGIYFRCNTCREMFYTPNEHRMNGNYVCMPCWNKTGECEGCKKRVDKKTLSEIDGKMLCSVCTAKMKFRCYECNTETLKSDATVKGKEWFCNVCAQYYDECVACKRLVWTSQEEMTLVKDELWCANCYHPPVEGEEGYEEEGDEDVYEDEDEAY